ncbi:MAG: hypothetical protein HY816_11450 [Candidatus Wallbacteria bacterium]|nr:hypothetical protein [Candidatus Wallbacteria bacterium]
MIKQCSVCDPPEDPDGYAFNVYAAYPLYRHHVQVIIPFVRNGTGPVQMSRQFLLVMNPYSEHGAYPWGACFGGVSNNRPIAGNPVLPPSTPQCISIWDYPQGQGHGRRIPFIERGFQIYRADNYLYLGNYDPGLLKLVKGYQFHVVGEALYFSTADEMLDGPCSDFNPVEISRCPKWNGPSLDSYNVGPIPECVSCDRSPPRVPKLSALGGGGERFSVNPAGQMEMAQVAGVRQRYASQGEAEGPMGIGWTHEWDVHATETFDGTDHYVLVDQFDRPKLRFRESGYSAYAQEPDQGLTLIRAADGTFRLIYPDQAELTFNAKNDLQSIAYSSGDTVLLSYDEGDRLSGISRNGDPVLVFSYNPEHKLATIARTGGGQWQFQYEGGAFLGQVEYPDGGVVGLAHSGTMWPGLITSITNHRGQVIHELYYDDRGRVVHYTDKGVGVLQDPATGLVTDDLGRITRTVYDDAGNVVERQIANGAIERSEYDAWGRLVLSSDAYGRVTTRSYDAEGNLTQVVDVLGNTTQYAYDGQGRLISKTDSLGRVSRMSYDAASRLVTTTDALGGTRHLGYASSGALERETDEAGRTTVFEYDSAGRVIRAVRLTPFGPIANETQYGDDGQVVATVDARGNRTDYEHDVMRRVTRIVGPPVSNGAAGPVTRPVTELSYDPDGNLVSRSDPLGRTTSFAYDVHGRKVSETDPAGGVRVFEYTGERLVRALDPLGGETRYQHDGVGHVVTVTDALGGVTRHAYDLAGNRVSTTDPRGSTNWVAHDALGRAVASTTPDGAVFLTGYDSVGNVTATTDPLGRTHQQSYDGLNRQIEQADALGVLTRFEHDAVGSRTAVVKAVGTALEVRDEYANDALGRMTSVTRAKGTVDETTVAYGYDHNGNVVSITNGRGKVWTFEYDALNRLTRETDPLGRSKQYLYDLAGQLVERRDAKGQKIQYDYSPVGKVVEARYIRADGSIENVARMSYDSVGNMIRVTDTNVDISQSFDDLNRITAINHAHLQKTQRNDWDSAGNRTAMWVDGIPNSTATYTWDSRNRLTAIHHASMGDVAYTYNAAGQKTTLTYANGIVCSYAYDTNGRLTSLDYRRPDNSQVFFENLTYDPRGNITQRVDDEGTHGYLYDDLDQLIRADYPDGSFEEFSYDKAGNRSSVTTAGGTANYEVDDADQLVSISGPNSGEVTSFSWTANGEMAGQLASGQTTPASYIWDVRSMLRQASLPGGVTVTNSYFPELWTGWRLAMGATGVPSVRVLWDRLNANLIADLDAAGSTISTYLSARGVDRVLAQGSSSETKFFLSDHLGSVMKLVDTSGTVSQSQKFATYGIHRGGSASISSRLAFIGREQSAVPPWVYLRARFYLPPIGAFLTPDPIARRQWSDSYRYCNRNPVLMVDRFGLEPTNSSQTVGCDKQKIQARIDELNQHGHPGGEGGHGAAQTHCEDCVTDPTKPPKPVCITCTMPGFGDLDPCVGKCIITKHEATHKKWCELLKNCSNYHNPMRDHSTENSEAVRAELQCLQSLLAESNPSVPSGLWETWNNATCPE